MIVRLPVVTADREAPPASAPVPQLPSGLRLLVIDDEPLLGETLGDLLQLLGYEAVVVTSGKAGLACLQDGQFDL